MKARLLRWGPLFLASVVAGFAGVSNARAQYDGGPPTLPRRSMKRAAAIPRQLFSPARLS